VTIGIDHLLLGENAIGDDEVLDDAIEAAHDADPKRPGREARSFRHP
jgi:hypothetical protein